MLGIICVMLNSSCTVTAMRQYGDSTDARPGPPVVVWGRACMPACDFLAGHIHWSKPVGFSLSLYLILDKPGIYH